MPLRLNAGDAGFAAAFEALVNGRREADEDVAQDVRAIIARVRAEGDAALADRPTGEDVSVMHDYVYLRANPAGPQHELWYHSAGCRSWLNVTRDTRTHEIASVRLRGAHVE